MFSIVTNENRSHYRKEVSYYQNEMLKSMLFLSSKSKKYDYILESYQESLWSKQQVKRFTFAEYNIIGHQKL